MLLLALAGVLAGASWPAQRAAPQQIACSSGYVDGVIGGEHKCLRAGEFCSSGYESDYERYGFTCVGGHLQAFSGSSPSTTTTTTSAPTTTAAPTATATAPTITTSSPPPTSTRPTTTSRTTTTSSGSGPPSVGQTILLRPRTKTSGCRIGVLPDHACSPGAYYSGLTKNVICAPGFTTKTIRNVPESEKHAVELEYGLAPKRYGRTLEIDHIVSLELGGSNDIANLFPQMATLPNHRPGFKVKDKLENEVHDAVCSGQLSLRSAQQQIASNWKLLYKKLFGVAP